MLLQIEPIARVRIHNFDHFSELFMEEHIGYSRDECQRMFAAYEFPVFFILKTGTRHAFRVNSVHCFLYFLYHLKSTAQRQSLDTPIFGYDYSILSCIFNSVVDFIDAGYSYLLRVLPQVANRFPEYNSCIKDRLNKMYPGLPIPPEAEGTVIFSDCCRLAVCRPNGLYLNFVSSIFL